MSEQLKAFLVDLASDPERLSRFEADPASELRGAALSKEEERALLSRDSARIRSALGATPDHMTFIRGIKRLKRGIRTIQAALEQIEQKERELSGSGAAKKSAARKATRSMKAKK